MRELTEDEADRLESAHALFAREDGVARARLLAALAAEVPSNPRSHRKARFQSMKRYASRTATAAALLLASGSSHGTSI